MPTVSIIMPVYNVENYVETALKSALCQTFEDFELIVVNDGSTDQSMKIVEQYSAVDGRIHILHKTNGGLSDARNVGLDTARGEYVLFMDSDDDIEKNLLERAVAHARQLQSDVVMFGYHNDIMNKQEQLVGSQKVIVPSGNYTLETIRQAPIDNQLLVLLGFAWNKLYKRELLHASGITFEKNLSLIEDIVFNEEVFQQAKRISILDEPLYHYRRRPRTTLISTFRTNIFELQLRAIDCRKKILELWGFPENQVNTVVAFLHASIIRNTCSVLVSSKNQLSLSKKYDYIKGMLENSVTKQRISYFQPSTPDEYLLKRLIQKEQTLVLLLVSYSYSRMLTMKKWLFN